MRDGKVAWRLTLCKCRKPPAGQGCPPKRGQEPVVEQESLPSQVRRVPSQGSALGKMNPPRLLPGVQQVDHHQSWHGWVGPGDGRARREESRGWALGNTDCPSSWLGGTLKKRFIWPRWVLVMTRRDLRSSSLACWIYFHKPGIKRGLPSALRIWRLGLWIPWKSLGGDLQSTDPVSHGCQQAPGLSDFLLLFSC